MSTPILNAKKSSCTWVIPALLAAGALSATAGDAWAQAGGDAATTEEAPVEQPVEEAAPPPPPPPAPNIQDEVRKVMDSMPKAFEFHGYVRSGFGYTSKLTKQQAFQAPGAFAKYRLGNETDEYGELIFVNNWVNPEQDGAWFKTQVLLTFQDQAQDNNFDAANYVMLIREAFAQAGGVLKGMPSAKFWAGQRYYQRHDVHINDFFFLDMSGRGGGVEDVDLGFGKLAVALMGSSQAGPNSATKTHIDTRISDINALGGSLTFWLNPVFVKYPEGGMSPDGDGSSVGVALGAMHTKGGFMGGYNKVMAQFGIGPGAFFFTFFFPEDKDAMMFRITEQAQIQPSENLSLMGMAVVQMHQNDENDATNTWISAGVRPVLHLTKYVSLAGELGVDFTDNGEDADAGVSGVLTKLTVAPQIATGSFFWARPVIRAYATAALWTDGFQGAVGGTTYAEDTFGLSAGVQMESWW